MTLQSRAEMVTRDWLQQLCVVNIDACKTHSRNIYFISARSRLQRNKIKSDNEQETFILFKIYFILAGPDY